MGDRLRTAGLFLASSDYYARALKKDPAKRELILNEIGLNYLEVEDARRAWLNLSKKCLREFPASPKKLEWTLNLGRAWSFGDKRDREKSRRILQTLIDEHPATPESRSAEKLLASL